MSANWQAGDKALCVDDSFSDPRIAHWSSQLPVKGTTYLVRDVPMHPTKGIIMLRLEGIRCVGVKNMPNFEAAWSVDRFRKVVPACDRVSVSQEAAL